ncbi:MAG TPA: hypothetical protein VG253_07010 [Streptosporangiaceae bacterium]|nr:hypothetical protein [Streptosporangiaceae bacterium]
MPAGFGPRLHDAFVSRFKWPGGAVDPGNEFAADAEKEKEGGTQVIIIGIIAGIIVIPVIVLYAAAWGWAGVIGGTGNAVKRGADKGTAALNAYHRTYQLTGSKEAAKRAAKRAGR